MDIKLIIKKLKKMVKKPTNKYLTISGFFSIVPGTLLIFSLIYCLDNTSIGMFRYLPSTIVIQVSTIMAGLVGAGYLVGNSVISYFTDKYYKKESSNTSKDVIYCPSTSDSIHHLNAF